MQGPIQLSTPRPGRETTFSYIMPFEESNESVDSETAFKLKKKGIPKEKTRQKWTEGDSPIPGCTSYHEELPNQTSTSPTPVFSPMPTPGLTPGPTPGPSPGQPNSTSKKDIHKQLQRSYDAGSQSEQVIREWVDATLQTAMSLDPKKYIPELFWSQKTRSDGRIFGQARQTSITLGVMKQNALGSALVQLKNDTAGDATTATTKDKTNALDPSNANATTKSNFTQVLAGVTADIGQPLAREGDLKVTLVINNGNNSANNVPLESWLQRLLLQILDREQLGIVPGKAAFGLDVTVVALNPSGGNIRDACLLAAMAALQSAVLPSIVVQDGRVYMLESDEMLEQIPSTLASFSSRALSLPVLPLPLSMGVITMKVPNESDDDNSQQQQEEKEYWLVDPTREEEMICDGIITVVVDGYNPEDILNMEYQGMISITVSTLALAARMAQGRAEELMPLFEQESPKLEP